MSPTSLRGSGFALAVLALSLLVPGAAAQAPEVLKHDNAVLRVAFSPDGKTLATVTMVHGFQLLGIVKLWDVAARKEVRKLEWKQTGVHAVAFSPDGQLIAASGWTVMLDGQFRKTTGIVRVCDAATGREQLSLTGHGSLIDALAFSPDGRFLATGGGDENVRLSTVAQGQEVRRLGGHGGRVTALTFSPDGKSLASVGANMKVRLWDVATGQERLVLQGSGKVVHAVRFAPDGRTVATVAGERILLVADAATGQERLRLKVKSDVCAVAFSPDGRTLAVGSGSGTNGEVTFWDAATGKSLATAKNDKGRCFDVAFSPDGLWLAAAVFGDAPAPGQMARGEVVLWDVRAVLANTK
jgi:WD40 repeat protein